MDSSNAPTKKGRSYLKWTDAMDKAMLDVFVEYFNKGDRAQNGWKPHVYTAAVKKVMEKCQVELTKENIISRSKTFDKHYVIVNNMLSQSGFGWDDDKNMVSVEDDVWNNYAKANKDAASYRYKVIKYWDMISTLYNRDRATGEGARTANESTTEMAEEIANTTATNKDANSSTKDDEDRPKKRYRSDDSIATMLGDKLDNFTAVFKADAPEPPPKPASPGEIWALLGGIPDLEDDQLLVIYDLLVADDRKFKFLLALPERMKKKWVLKQIST
ncbi:hypothetical protein ACQ4PT_014229 [Festuca glaucescens]